MERAEIETYLGRLSDALLRRQVAAPEYLLAMKCMSMRIGKDETDIRDIRFLMQESPVALRRRNLFGSANVLVRG